MNERYVTTHAVNNAVEHKKHTLIYFFNDQHVSLHFKAISALEWLQDDFLFVSVNNPSENLMKDYYINNLPSIRGALAPLSSEEDLEVDSVKQFQYGGPIDFDEILFNLLKLSNKQEEFKKKQEYYVQLRSQGKNPKFENSKKKKKNKSKTKSAKKDDLWILI